MTTVGAGLELANKLTDLIVSARNASKKGKQEVTRHEVQNLIFDDPVYYFVDRFDADGMLTQRGEEATKAKTDGAKNHLKYTHKGKRISINREAFKTILLYMYQLENALEDL